MIYVLINVPSCKKIKHEKNPEIHPEKNENSKKLQKVTVNKNKITLKQKY